MTDRRAPESIGSAAPTFLVRLAGGLTFAAGVLSVIAAVQMLTSVEIVGPLDFAPYAQIAIGALALPVGWMLARARGWAAIAGTALAVVASVACGAWSIYSATHGFLSVLALLAAAVWVAAAATAPMAIAPSRRADAARAAGMDLGL